MFRPRDADQVECWCPACRGYHQRSARCVPRWDDALRYQTCLCFRCEEEQRARDRGYDQLKERLDQADRLESRLTGG
jgi:hypothetical protein